ncbi:MAG TPA: hypothetical protein VMK12_00360 [Anaeromyxobacteraceae bacterium]|nr:hypothetical protein [Anaeromyxobacteraceae bacterium]
MAAILAFLQKLAQTALARERLPETSCRDRRSRRPSLGKLVFGWEELPMSPEREGRRPGTILNLLFAAEPLAEEPPRHPSRERRSLAKALFAAEPLPRASPGSAPRRSRWLAWLFAPERIDRG